MMSKYFSKFELPYNLDGFEPYINEQTMRTHYEDIYSTCIVKINNMLDEANPGVAFYFAHYANAIDGVSSAYLNLPGIRTMIQSCALQYFSIDPLLPTVRHAANFIDRMFEDTDISQSGFTDFIKNYEKSHVLLELIFTFSNHNFFWNCLSRYSKPPYWYPSLITLIQNSFSTLSGMMSMIIRSALTSSQNLWVIVLYDKLGKQLFVVPSMYHLPAFPMMTTNNEYRFFPILMIDLAEHAYSNQYLGNKEEYLNNIIPIINWEFMNKCIEAADMA